jgi:hypothetical protein
VELVISSRNLLSLDVEGIYLKRGDTYYGVPSSETTVGVGNKAFTLLQNTGVLWVNAAAYLFDVSDTFWVKVTGHSLGGFEDNLVWQARDILMEYGGLLSGEFHANWITYRDKATPAQSSISTIKSRVWIGETQAAMTYALSMLEQVRLEAFIDRDLKIKINSLHFEDWNPTPTHTIRNWDVVQGSFQTSIDERNNFNAAQGVFNYLPDLNENAYSTAIYQNASAITQVGKRIAKKVVFPNLYVQSDAIYQLIEFIRLASSTLEILSVSLTWRSMLRDIGEFANIQVQIGSSIFDQVPAMIRDIGYDPDGLKLVVKMWSMMMVPFPGYIPGYAGTVGGYSATIIEET